MWRSGLARAASPVKGSGPCSPRWTRPARLPWEVVCTRLVDSEMWRRPGQGRTPGRGADTLSTALGDRAKVTGGPASCRHLFKGSWLLLRAASARAWASPPSSLPRARWLHADLCVTHAQLGVEMPVCQPGRALSLHNVWGTSGYTCSIFLQTGEKRLRVAQGLQEKAGLGPVVNLPFLRPLLRA